MNKILNINGLYANSTARPPGDPASGEQRPVPVLPADRVTLSRHALEAAPGNQGDGNPELTPEEKEVVEDLKQRDAEVKAHEQAHMSAGGGVAGGGATYQYQTGPDGKQYAVGGEVKIDLSPAGSPEATIRKMQQIQAAALAPAQPSGTDRAVAAQAAQIEVTARLEKSQENAQALENLPGQPESPAPDSQPAEPGSLVDLMA